MSEFVSKKISELVGEIKDLLESEFKNVLVEGEISNLSLSSAGHWYFTLSDSEASLSSALFKFDALKNPQIKLLKDGMKVLVSGEINVFSKRGTFQLIAKKIVLKGAGDLKEQFEKLKARLRSEGLFDIENKKTIPLMPRRVAIITAKNGAALQDFLNIYKRRCLWMDIIIIPSLVQGSDAPQSLRQSLFRIIKYSLDAPPEKKIDLIVFARGGGSMEDLWAFNDEGLMWDIFNCPIPTLSAIGHETDFTICDFVSDKRAETPSAAAELITHHQTMIKEKIKNLKMRLKNTIEMKHMRLKARLRSASPEVLLSDIQNYYLSLIKRLNRASLEKRAQEFLSLNQQHLFLDELIMRSNRSLLVRIQRSQSTIEKYHAILNVTDPKHVLKRGFTYIENKEEVVVRAFDFDQMKNGSEIKIHFYDGERVLVK